MVSDGGAGVAVSGCARLGLGVRYGRERAWFAYWLADVATSEV